jgi:hypothetical protein
VTATPTDHRARGFALGAELDALMRTQSGAGFSSAAWAHCAERDVFRMALARPGGTGELAATEIVAFLEGLGDGCTDGGFTFSLGAQLWSATVMIDGFGTTEQRSRYLDPMCAGSSVVATAMTEAEAGSDVFSMTTEARSEGDSWVLRGTKLFSTNLPVASAAVVFARTGSLAPFHVSAFIVERSDAGARFGPPLDTLGLQRAPIGVLELDDVAVGADRLVGRVGGGIGLFRSAMRAERGYIMAPLVGAMARHVRLAATHVRERRQFGQPLASYQAVTHRIADMRVRHDAGSALLHRWAAEVDAGEDGSVSASVAKVFVSEAFIRSAGDLLHLLGAAGYLRGSAAESDVRAAYASTIYAGTSEMQRTIVAEHLGLRPERHD